MPQKKRKKIESISDQMKGDKLHLFRLKKFLQYLKQYNAEIKLTKDDGYPMVFKANGKRDELKLKHLVAEVLNIREDYASKLLNGPLTFSEVISDKDRIEDLGDILDDITMHFGSHLTPDKLEFIPIRELSFSFFYRKNDIKDEEELLQHKSIDQIKSKFTQVDQFLILHEEVNKGVDSFCYDFGYYDYHLVHQMFFEEMTDLCSFFCKETSESKKQYEKVTNELKNLLKEYNNALKIFDSNNFLLPGYVDLSLICDIENVKNYIGKNFQSAPTFLWASRYIPYSNSILYRYELLHLVSQNYKDVLKWSPIQQALLILCTIELKTVDLIISKVLYMAKQKVLFNLYTSNSYNSTKVQVAHLDFESVSKILMHYHISESLDNIFAIKTNSVLKYPLKAYVDSSAVEHYYESGDIYIALHHTLNVFLQNKIIEDLHGYNNILSSLEEPGLI